VVPFMVTAAAASSATPSVSGTTNSAGTAVISA
jgi:hypothetical protein